jgi:transketolase
MRTAFIETLCQLAEGDERIWLLTGDLGYSVLERFASRFPKRYVNVGVAEQNMTGIAAGLALCGKTVFTYSIANFPTVRCLEQIRNDVGYHGANVKIVAIGGGLAYGAQGYTHYAVEDLAAMRAMPNMVVVAPGDPVETRLATRAIAAHAGPCYLRLGKAGEPLVHRSEPAFQLGRALLVRPGTDATLVSTGGVLRQVVDAAEMLSEQGISVRVVSMPTVHPLDESALNEAARDTGLVCVVEEHHRVGGLSDAVARCLAGSPACRVRFLTLDTGELIAQHAVGSQTYLTGRFGLSAVSIRDKVAGWIREARP